MYGWNSSQTKCSANSWDTMMSTVRETFKGLRSSPPLPEFTLFVWQRSRKGRLEYLWPDNKSAGMPFSKLVNTAHRSQATCFLFPFLKSLPTSLSGGFLIVPSSLCLFTSLQIYKGFCLDSQRGDHIEMQFLGRWHKLHLTSTLRTNAPPPLPHAVINTQYRKI